MTMKVESICSKATSEIAIAESPWLSSISYSPADKDISRRAQLTVQANWIEACPVSVAKSTLAGSTEVLTASLVINVKPEERVYEEAWPEQALSSQVISSSRLSPLFEGLAMHSIVQSVAVVQSTLMTSQIFAVTAVVRLETNPDPEMTIFDPPFGDKKRFPLISSRLMLETEGSRAIFAAVVLNAAPRPAWTTLNSTSAPMG